ncbi:MAG: glycosyltransferase family 4 protein [Bryobacteraceae bacterium]
MKSATRILYLDYTNNIGLGGGQRSLSLLVRNLDRERYEPLIAAPPGERMLELIGEDVRRFELPLGSSFRALSRDEAGWSRLPAAAFSAWPAVRLVRRLVREQRVALIHANNLKMLLLAAAACPRLPRFWHVRDIFPAKPAVQSILAIAARLSTRVVSVSRAVASHLPPGVKNRVLYNAVDLPDLPARPHTVDWADRPPTIGFIGRLDHWKGLPVLLDAFAKVRTHHPTARLLVAGDGPEASRVVGEGVERLPFQKDLSAVWPRIDIAVVPSTEPDPFPRSVIEAMSWGKPVIGSATGGIPEAIDPGVTGLLFRPGDRGELASLLNRVLSDPIARGAMGRNGRERCERMFSVASQAEKMGLIYQEVLEQKVLEGAAPGCAVA